jgi:hypothetical protein
VHQQQAFCWFSFGVQKFPSLGHRADHREKGIVERKARSEA